MLKTGIPVALPRPDCLSVSTEARRVTMSDVWSLKRQLSEWSGHCKGLEIVIAGGGGGGV